MTDTRVAVVVAPAARVTLVRAEPWPARVRVASLPGPTGPTGPPGGALPYVHVQAAAAASWPIPHGRGRPVDVTVLVDGVEVLADVDQTDPNVAVVTWPGPTSGAAAIF